MLAYCLQNRCYISAIAVQDFGSPEDSRASLLTKPIPSSCTTWALRKGKECFPGPYPNNVAGAATNHNASNLMSIIKVGINFWPHNNSRCIASFACSIPQWAPTTEQDTISYCFQNIHSYPLMEYRHQDLETIPSHCLVAPHAQKCCWGSN